MRRIAFRGFALCLAIVLFAVPGARAEVNRVALVIGNSAYQHTQPLANPRNDAADIAAALRKLGFKVTEGGDLDKASMEKTIRLFTESLPGAKTAIFFYAGHGLQVEGQNYLIPTDAKLATRGALGFETIRLDLVQRAMESETNTNIIFLDACRNNPLGRNLAKTLGTRSANVGQGLAQVESGEGTLISFSTQPGNVALDGDGRNSPYAQALLTHINKPGTDLSNILINIRNDVMRATERRQIPWEHSAMTAPFYFSDAPQQTNAVPATNASNTAAPASADVEITYWNSVKDSTSPALVQSYLDKFPNGNFRPLALARIEQLKQPNVAKPAQNAAINPEIKPRDEAEAMAEEKAREEAKARETARLAAAAEEAKAQEKAKRAAREREFMEQERHRAEKAAQEQKDKQRLAALQVDRDHQLQMQMDERKKLARGLQQELKRVGCDPVDVNGNWDARTQAALQKFAVRTRASLVSTEPSAAALKAVSAAKTGACGIECPAGQSADGNGTCVAQSRGVQNGGGKVGGGSSWESQWRSTGR